MVGKIKGSDVVGMIDEEGRCPSCETKIIVKDVNYKFIKNRGIAEFPNGERYVKCSCGKFVMLPRKAA